MQTAKLHASRKRNSIKMKVMSKMSNRPTLVDSVQFVNIAILAKFNIVSLRRRSVDYPPTLHCAQNAIDLVKCCTNEISCAHRLQNIRGNIGVYPPPRMGEKQPQTWWTWLMVSCFEP